MSIRAEVITNAALPSGSRITVSQVLGRRVCVALEFWDEERAKWCVYSAQYFRYAGRFDGWDQIDSLAHQLVSDFRLDLELGEFIEELK